MQITRYLLLCLWLLATGSASAQQTLSKQAIDSSFVAQDVMGTLYLFLDEMNTLISSSNIKIHLEADNAVTPYYASMMRTSIDQINISLQSFDLRWNLFTQTQQSILANNQDLMDIMVEVQQKRQAATDTLEIRVAQCGALTNFAHAEVLLANQDSVYQRLYKTAFQLSLVQKMAPRLEKLKAKEQLRFQQLQQSHQQAQDAVALLPVLQLRMPVLDDRFAHLQAISQKIQSTEYKPLIQRIKDYLIGIACVAIVIMFIQMVVSKIQAAKKMRESMKKYEELMNKNGMGDYPSI